MPSQSPPLFTFTPWVDNRPRPCNKPSNADIQSAIPNSRPRENHGLRINLSEKYAEKRIGIFHNPRTLHAELSKRFDTIQLPKKTTMIVDILEKLKTLCLAVKAHFIEI